MMDSTNLLFIIAFSFATLTIGLFLGFWIARRINSSQLDVIAEKIKSETTAELATARERVRGQEIEFQKINDELAELKCTSEIWRNDLDAVRDERAQLAERAARVSIMDMELAQANTQNKSLQDKILQLSTSEAEKARELQSTRSRNNELSVELDAAKKHSNILSNALSETQSKQTGLLTDNKRIAPLTEQISALDKDKLRLQNEIASLRENIGRTQAELQAEKDAHTASKAELMEKKAQLTKSQAESGTQQSELSKLSTRLESEQKNSEEKLLLLSEAKEALSNQFKTLANEILEEKSKRFTEQNQANLGQLLDPLKNRLQEFQGKVEHFYSSEGQQRSALAQQVVQLLALNKTLSDDAKNLTQALKGSSKSQGSWGELILERVLEASGLRKGDEYQVQESHSRDDGSRAQPDVIIRLPEDRHLVVDAKVSLKDYEEYSSAESDIERQAALRRHLDSIRSHIKGLSEKNYQSLYELKSLDFVLMFVPIEPAFMLGVTQDNNLFMDAWAKNVLLVSPSTLLFVVRTVAHLWRQEAQNRNAQDIAKRGAELYDRFTSFVEDLSKVGKRLEDAQTSYNDAFAKLSKNKGNVIRQAQMLIELGVKPSKALPPKLLEDAGASEQI